MTRAFAFVSAFILTLIPLRSEAADWSLMSIGANGQALLIDSSSILNEGGKKIIWTMVVLKTSGGAILHDAIRNRLALDCRQAEFTSLNYIEYLSGQVVQEIESDGKSRPIVPGTTMGDMFDYVCRDKPISEQQKHFTEQEIRRLLSR